MAITIKHAKTDTISDWTQTDLDAQIALGNFPPGTVLADIVLPSDWNNDHTFTGTLGVSNGGTGATTLTGYVKGNGTSAFTASSTVPSTDITGLGTMSTQNANAVAITGGTMSGVTVTGYIPTTEKGVALGVATLDGGGTVPVSQLPAAVLGALSYQGTWNASTNTPTLTSSVGTKGYYYVVNVAGSTNLNGITDWLVGDWAVYNGSAWQKIDNTDAVTSVNGYTGTVVLTTTDVAEGTNQYFTTARARTSVSAGTGISYDNATGVITNSSPSLGGDVVGPASATDNAIARYDTTTGKLLQNSVVTIGDTGAATGFTTLSASTSVTTPIVQATNSGGLALKNASGTTQMSMGAGGGDNISLNVSTNLNGSNAQIDISPTGTGHVHINPTGSGSIQVNPTSVGTIDNMTIGATTPKNGSFVDFSVTGTTSFDGSQGTAGQVLTSAGTGATPTWTTPAAGTVTSVTGTSPIASSGGTTPAISISQATTSTNGYLSSTDWNTFNGKQPAGTYVTSVGATSPVTSTGGTTPTIAMPAATTSVSGYLTSTDWTTFNNKGSGTVTSVSGTTGRITSTGGNTPVIDLASGVATAGTTGSSTLIPVVTIDTYGRVTSITTASNPQGTVTSVTGTAPVVSSGGATPAISMAAANTTTNGYLTSTDWNTFNGKGSGTVTSVAALTLGTTGTDLSSTVATGTTTPVITLQVPTASASNRGALSSADWTTFNSKAPSVTYTSTYVPYGQGTTTPALSSSFTYNSTTGDQTAPQQVASNGIIVNAKSIASSYTITASNNAMSVGPVTVATGQSVTVSSGSRWVVL